jgi:hypothetical protein
VFGMSPLFVRRIRLKSRLMNREIITDAHSISKSLNKTVKLGSNRLASRRLDGKLLDRLH